MVKNFKEVVVSLGQEKKNIVKYCQEVGLTSLKKSVQASKDMSLKVFFSAKTHKDGVPFRANVSETSTWQREVARFLQRHLNKLVINDPFQIKESNKLIAALQATDACGCDIFSIDVQDLYYSIPQHDQCRAVLECIETNDLVVFQNSCGKQSQ